MDSSRPPPPQQEEEQEEGAATFGTDAVPAAEMAATESAAPSTETTPNDHNINNDKNTNNDVVPTATEQLSTSTETPSTDTAPVDTADAAATATARVKPPMIDEELIGPAVDDNDTRVQPLTVGTW